MRHNEVKLAARRAIVYHTCGVRDVARSRAEFWKSETSAGSCSLRALLSSSMARDHQLVCHRLWLVLSMDACNYLASELFRPHRPYHTSQAPDIRIGRILYDLKYILEAEARSTYMMSASDACQLKSGLLERR